MAVEFNLNGARVRLDLDPETPLLEVLRNDLSMNAPKFGCGLGQCGACSVLLDGESVRSCVMPLGNVAERSVITLEGLGTPENPHPIQRAFIREQAIQCGYCANGVIIAAAALLRTEPSPDRQAIQTALSGHLCRCGAQPRMLQAIAAAVDDLNRGQ